MASIPSWKEARPARLLSGGLWLRNWPALHQDNVNCTSDPEGHTPLFLDLARGRFGLSVAALRLSAAWERAFDGRSLSLRKGGTRLRIMNGMTREASQQRGGWKSPAGMEYVYNKTHSEEVVPEAKACAVLDVTSFLGDLDREVCAHVDEILGS